jgi:hypothetical protein
MLRAIRRDSSSLSNFASEQQRDAALFSLRFADDLRA